MGTPKKIIFSVGVLALGLSLTSCAVIEVPTPGPTVEVPGPATTTTVTVKVPVPGPTVTVTVPGPATTTTVQGPTIQLKAALPESCKQITPKLAALTTSDGIISGAIGKINLALSGVERDAVTRNTKSLTISMQAVIDNKEILANEVVKHAEIEETLKTVIYTCNKDME